MGTRGNYIFRRNGKYYVFYNHFDSYFSGLGNKIVAEIRNWTAADFDLAVALLDAFPADMKATDEGRNEFKSLLMTLKNPKEFCLDDVSETSNKGFDSQYTYTLDFDRNLFVVEWCDYKVGWMKQNYRLTAIPEDWISLTGRED